MADRIHKADLRENILRNYRRVLSKIQEMAGKQHPIGTGITRDAALVWQKLEEHLYEGYNNRQGSFARVRRDQARSPTDDAARLQSVQ
jgi:ribosomal protein L17